MSRAKQIQYKTVDEVRNAAVSFVNVLSTGELLSGTPTVTANSTTVTISNQGLNTGEITVNCQTVAIGKAATFTVAGGADDGEYTITVTCGTDGSPAQTLEGIMTLRVIDAY